MYATLYYFCQIIVKLIVFFIRAQGYGRFWDNFSATDRYLYIHDFRSYSRRLQSEKWEKVWVFTLIVLCYKGKS